MKPTSHEPSRWTLTHRGHTVALREALSRCVSDGDRLDLSKTLVAAAFDPRQSRLEEERKALELLNKESDNVHVEPVNHLPGSEPEQYRVTFRCQGIKRLDAQGVPEYAGQHECRVICSAGFPFDTPKVSFLPNSMWHPNVDYRSGEACVNEAEWVGGMSLVDLCRQLFEMIQYQNYHVLWTKPYPRDPVVAKWVREVAEPNRLVNKSENIALDNQMFYRGLNGQAELPTPVPPPITPQPSRIKIRSTSKVDVVKKNTGMAQGRIQVTGSRKADDAD